MRFLTLLMAIATGAANSGNTLRVGDGKIDGTKLVPYELTWQQCNLQAGDWVIGNELTERLVAVGDHILRIQQFSQRADGSTSISTTYLDRNSMAPLRLEYQAVAADGSPMAKTEHSLTPTGYRGQMMRGDQSKQVQGTVSSEQLNGGIMGLPLATLEFQSEPLEFSASMINFDATYTVTASWVGKEVLTHEGKKIEASLIDIHWIHNEIGDVYPGGPNDSGGRYWVVAKPPAGFPYVARYKTDTYAVEYVPGVCPTPGE